MKQLEETDKTMVSSLMSFRYALGVLDMDGHGSLHAEGRIGDKSCLVTIYTGASMTNARPDITAGLSKQREEPLSTEAVKGIRIVESR